MNATERLDQIEALVNAASEPLHPDARMQAYYYGFDRTGCGPIDALLSAVAVAGKGSHGTDCWGLSDDYGYYDNRPGLPRNPYVEGTPQEGSAINLIELTAADGAAKITAALAATDALVAALRAVLELADRWATQSTDHDEDTEQQIDDGKAIVRVIEETLS